MRAFTALALAAALLAMPGPAFAEPTEAHLRLTLPGTAYGEYHYQDFSYRITAQVGPLHLTASHYEYGDVPLFVVALSDPVQRQIVSEAFLTTTAAQADLTVPAAGAYDLIVRPLFEQWETTTNPGLKVGAEGLQVAHTEANCISLIDFADFTVFNTPQSLQFRPCTPGSGFISRIAVNDEILYESTTSDGGQEHQLAFDPQEIGDGLFLLDVRSHENAGENRTRTVRTFMIDLEDTYTDVMPSHWARQPVELMSHFAILSGHGDGTFDPDAPVLRKEFAKMVALTFDLPLDGNGPSPFADAPGDWSQPYIDALHTAGLVQGELVDGQRYFRPDRRISRSEAITIIGRAMEVDQADVSMLPPLYIDQNEIPAWAWPSIGVLSIDRWISGFPDGEFHPHGELARAQAAKILAHALGLEPSDVDGGGPRPPGFSSGWTHQFGGPDRSNFHPRGQGGSTAELLWSSSVKADGGGSTVLGDGLLFTTSWHGWVYGVLPETGQVLWRTRAGIDRFGGTLAYSPEHNLLFAAFDGDRYGRLTALNPATGRKVWERETTGQHSLAAYSPVVAGDLVLVAAHGSGSTIYAFDAETGDLVWSRPSPGGGAPTVAGDRLFVSYFHGQAFAMRLSDGELLWQRKDGWSGHAPPPVVGHGLVFATDDADDQVFALDEATGAVVWQVPGQGQVAVDDRHVWVQQPAGGLAVLDPATGESVATVPVCQGVPVIGATHAYISCLGQIQAIDRTTFAVAPVAPGGMVLAIGDGRLYYLRNDPSPWDRYLLSAMAVR